MDRTPLLRLALDYVVGRVQRHEIVPDTARRQRSILRDFAASYGKRPLANLSRCDVERWLATRHHLRAGSRRYEFSTVRQFVRWLQLHRHVRRDPTVGLTSPRVPRSVPRALTSDEVTRLEAVLPDARARAVFVLMHVLGLRRCEVLTIQTGDWDRHTGTMHVRHGKGGHERVIPVTHAAARDLDVYTRTFGAGPIIRRNDGIRPISNSYLGALMATWMRDAGVKHAAFDGRACHSLRHTAASNLLDTEPDLRVTQQFLGHVNLSSTQIYLRRVGLDRMRAAMERSGPAA